MADDGKNTFNSQQDYISGLQMGNTPLAAGSDDFMNQQSEGNTVLSSNDYVAQQSQMLFQEVKAQIQNLQKQLNNSKLQGLVKFGSSLDDFFRVVQDIRSIAQLRNIFDNPNFRKIVSRVSADASPSTFKLLKKSKELGLNNVVSVSSFISKLTLALNQDIFQSKRYLSTLLKQKASLAQNINQIGQIYAGTPEFSKLITLENEINKRLDPVFLSLRKLSGVRVRFLREMGGMSSRIIRNMLKALAKKSLIFALMPLFLALCCCMVGLMIFMLVINIVKEDPVGTGARFLQNCGVQSPEDCLRTQGLGTLNNVLK